jgi:hypothetical protein
MIASTSAWMSRMRIGSTDEDSTRIMATGTAPTRTVRVGVVTRGPLRPPQSDLACDTDG